MYLGQIAEIGPAEAIYAPPYHPYTEALLSAVPIPDPRVEQKHIRLEGIGAQRPQSAQRLPLPHPLPAPGDDAARRRPDLRDRGAALARRRKRPSHLLPHPAGDAAPDGRWW